MVLVLNFAKISEFCTGLRCDAVGVRSVGVDKVESKKILKYVYFNTLSARKGGPKNVDDPLKHLSDITTYTALGEDAPRLVVEWYA